MKNLEELIFTAKGKEKADLVLKNGYVFNVFTGKFKKADVAIQGKYIVGLGNYEGKQEIDLKGKYITPGFIDAHVHIESSMVRPSEFARAVVASGTTTVIIDPHEIANVSGINGIEYMLEESKDIPLNTYVMLPSCVPSTQLENSGAILEADDLKQLLADKRVLGLGEVMDVVSVIEAQPKILKKLVLMEDKIIDGHAPGLKGKNLAAYRVAGITSDHECTNVEEAKERLEMGMYIMMREGSASKNLLDLLPIVDVATVGRCLFVTDDRHPEDLINLGHINHMIKLAVEEDIEIEHAIQMATINSAIYFGLKDIGAIAPSYRADINVFDNLKDWRPIYVLKDGVICAQAGTALFKSKYIDNKKVFNSMKIKDFTIDKLKIQADTSKARVIGLIPEQIVTKNLELYLESKEGEFKADIAKDLLKLAVIERHNYTGNVGVALVQNFGLKSGALASTIAHDSHNLVVIGTNDEDMAVAVKELELLQGGIIIVKEKKVLKSIPLPIAGLMSDKDIYSVQEEVEAMKDLARSMGVKDTFDPFMTLAFLSLPVIPALKLTDKGLVDVMTQKIIEVSLK